MGHSAFMKSLPGERIRRNPGRRSMNWNCDYYIPQGRIDDGDARVYEEDIHEYDTERQLEYMAGVPAHHDVQGELGASGLDSEPGAAVTVSVMDLARPAKVRPRTKWSGRGKGKGRQRYGDIQALDADARAPTRYAEGGSPHNPMSLSFKFTGAGDVVRPLDDEAFSEIFGVNASDIGSVSELWEDDWDSGSESGHRNDKSNSDSDLDSEDWEDIYESDSDGPSEVKRVQNRVPDRISYAAALREGGR